MNKSNCLNCLFAECCIDQDVADVCGYYSPIYDSEDALEHIEDQRKVFYTEWFRYIDDDRE